MTRRISHRAPVNLGIRYAALFPLHAHSVSLTAVAQIDVKAIKFTLNAPYSAWDEREKAEFTVYPVKATITRDDSSSSTVDVLKRYSQFDELHEAVRRFFRLGKPLCSYSSKKGTRR